MTSSGLSINSIFFESGITKLLQKNFVGVYTQTGKQTKKLCFFFDFIWSSISDFPVRLTVLEILLLKRMYVYKYIFLTRISNCNELLPVSYISLKYFEEHFFLNHYERQYLSRLELEQRGSKFFELNLNKMVSFPLTTGESTLLKVLRKPTQTKT